MSNQKSTNELLSHKEQSIQCLDQYIESLIASGDPKLMSKADKLSYWLQDWTSYLNFESSFSASSLRRYKRGEIIKVHLGFNVGSEEGGLHYAVVLDKNNAKTSPVVTIIPLTSVKSTTDLSNLKNGSIFLGNEIFTSLNSKFYGLDKQIHAELANLQSILSNIQLSDVSAEIGKLNSRIDKLTNQLSLLKRMQKEINKMKTGSIALVNQITTVSKIRIYDPKTDHDILSGIKLSNEKLDLIDEEIKKKFTNN